jgi:hypothetical protein
MLALEYQVRQIQSTEKVARIDISLGYLETELAYNNCSSKLFKSKVIS